MRHPFKKQFTVIGLLLIPALANAQSSNTVSLGLDYSEGKYGESETSSTWQVPVVLRHENGPWILKLNIPYVRAKGVAAAGGDLFSDKKQTQSGIGDVTASAMYSIYYNEAAVFGIDVGGKAKFSTADSAKTLITTGKNDYTVLVDVFKMISKTTLFGTVGWTRKGDPAGVDFENPLLVSLGVSQKISDSSSWGISYDYREKVTSKGDPISEAMLFFTHRYTKDVKGQTYLVTGFSDASPDFGIGASIGYGF